MTKNVTKFTKNKLTKQQKIDLCNFITSVFRDGIYKFGLYTKETYNRMTDVNEFDILEYIDYELISYKFEIYELHFYRDFICVMNGKELYIELYDEKTDELFIYKASVHFTKQEPLFNIYAQLYEYNNRKVSYINDEYEKFLMKLTYE